MTTVIMVMLVMRTRAVTVIAVIMVNMGMSYHMYYIAHLT